MPEPLITGRKPRVAVIGYGFAGRSFHSYLVGLAPGLELYGVSSRDPATREKIVAERGCNAFESFEQVIEDPKVDLVVLATPHDTHKNLAVRAMGAGKHVVTDKVMCLNRRECDEMVEASRKSGRFLGVFHNRRWDGDFLTLKKIIGDGALGEVRWIEMAWNRYGVPKTDRWRGRVEAGGGKIYDLGAHLLDQVLLLFAAPVSGAYARVHHDFPQAEVESHAMITLSFDDGRTAVIDVGAMSRVPKPRVYAVGTNATFIKYGIDPQEPAMIAGDIDAAKEDEKNYGRLHEGKEEKVVHTIPGRWRNFYENVADVLTKGAEPAVKLPEMQRMMSTFDAIFESARTGRVARPA